MLTFIFDICFTCTNTNTIKVMNKTYKALNKKLAYTGINQYCRDNKTMANFTVNLLNEKKG